MNTNRQFKVIVSIIVTLMIVILGLNISKAQRFDDNSLLVDGIYCIQGGVAINENSRYVTVKKPDGNGGTISESVLAYVVNNYTAGDMRTITSAHNASVNQRKMAYVLWTDRSGHKDYGGAQTYIWVEKSIASSGLGVSVTAVGKGNTPQGNQMRAKVDNYINVEATDASIKKSSNVAKTVKSENYKVGPFSVDYNGTITKVQIKYKDEDELVDVKASSIIQNDKKLNNISDLAKNTYFYIMNTSEKEVESVSISVHKEHPIYSVTFRPWICKGDTYTGIAAVGWTVQHIQDAPKDKQDLIECGSYGQDVCKTDATYTFNVKVYKGKIKLTKYGTWNGENKPLPKMQFKLYSTLYQKWVEQTADNKVKYVKNIDKATTFKTNSNGKLKITGLYAGESYSYELVEIGGKQPYYVQPLQVTQKTTPELRIVYGKTVYEGRKCYTFEGIKLPSEINTNTEVEIIDDATYGNLSVKKISKNNNERALRDVEIKIWSEERQAWLMTLDDGSYNYKEIYNDETGDMFSQYYTKDSNDSRTIFKTNKNGLINIKHIEKGEYKIYETKTFGIEYDITKQTGYDETLGMALLGTVSVDNETTDFEVEYEQIEREKGDLVLQKNGVYGINGEMITEKLENMSFKIYSNVEGDQKFGNWVVIKDDKELYPDGPIVDFVKDFDDATTFTTDENGQLTVKGLYLDFNNYVLVEVPTVVKEGDKQHTYYIDPIVISGDYNKNVGKMKVGENEYCAISNVKIEKDTSINIEINDNRTSGDLTVEKQDYTHNELKLAGAEFKIQIIKADYVDGVENMWLKALDNGSYDYSDYKHDEYLTSDENEAGVFKTGENGKFEVKSILNGTYQVYETKAPYGYDITKQDGYDPDKKWVVLGDHPTITTENNIVKYSFNNKKVVDSFEGDVWLDAEAQTKLGGRDDVYKEEQDKLLKEPITVNLRKIENDEIIATTQTVKEENGEYYKHYKFTKKDNGEDIIYWDLAEAYVEFIYNNKYIDDENYGYFTVEPFVGTDSKINSKAQEYTMTATRLDDDKLTGTTGEEPGRAVTNKDNKGLEVQDILSRNRKVEEKINNNNVSRDDLYNEPLTSYYDDTTYVIKDINLGLVEKYDPDYVTSETLAYTKFVMNGYTYTYEYGGTPAITSNVVPVVHEQTSKKYYTGKIYPTDVAYNAENGIDEFKVYVVYRVDIRNLEAMNIPKDYVETKDLNNGEVKGKLYLDTLTNNFDSERFELDTTSNAGDSTDFKLWKENEKGVATFDIYNEESPLKNGIEALDTKTALVQYRVKESVLETILAKNGEEIDKINATPASKSYTTAHHEYLRKDQLWNHTGAHEFEGCRGKAAYKLDENDYIHKSRIRDNESAALFLTFTLGEDRTIKGTVFEDTVTDESGSNNTHLGDGIWEEDSEKNHAQDVKVELLDADKNVATLYAQDTSSANGASSKLANDIKTDENGNYTIEGVVPGLYYIRFTYGDGTQKMMPAGDAIFSNNYKSTIINTDSASDYIKNANETKSDDMKQKQTELSKLYQNKTDETKESDLQKIVEWYKYISDKKYSIATDDLNDRKVTEEYVYSKGKDGESNSNGALPDNVNITKNGSQTDVTYPVEIHSYSPMFGISIENDQAKVAKTKQDLNANVTEDGQHYVEESKTNYDDDMHLPEYSGFNFGLIEEAKTDLAVDLKIVNVNLTYTTATTPVSGNPKENDSKVLTALDNVDGGSKYARLEVEQQNIHGAELEVTYEMTITNKTAKDYIEDEYLSDGVTKNPEYGTYYKYGESPNAYLKEVKVREVIDQLDPKFDYDYTIGTVEETINHVSESRFGEKTDTNNVKLNDTGEQGRISITDWEGIESDATTSIQYKAHSALNAELKDANFENLVEITSISLDKLTNLNSDWEWKADTSVLTVVPDTGEDRSNTYWIVATVALSTLAVGLVILKKHILK